MSKILSLGLVLSISVWEYYLITHEVGSKNFTGPQNRGQRFSLLLSAKSGVDTIFGPSHLFSIRKKFN